MTYTEQAMAEFFEKIMNPTREELEAYKRWLFPFGVPKKAV